MSAPNAQTQWYLARDGKQYGPLTDVELSKFVELGHLLATDLLWREGFADWQPALSVFPETPAPSPPRPAPRPAPEPAMATAQPGAQAGPSGASQASLAAQAAAAWPRQDEPGMHPSEAQAPQRAARAQPRHGGPSQAAQPQRLQPGAAARQPARGYPQNDRGLRAEPQLGAQGQADRKRIDPAEFDEDTDFEPGGRVLRKALVFLIILAVLGGAGYGAWTFRGQLMALSGLAAGSGSSGTSSVGFDRRSLDAPPLKGLEGTPAQIDGNMQQAALWRLLKREFPDWYEERVKEISQLPNKAEAAQKTAQALVALRRQNLSGALSASIPRVRLVASTFFENLAELRKTSEAACFEFIARGEASPAIVQMLQGSPQVSRLQAQMVAVYEAIADGRKSPRAYPAPKREDYEKLAADLQQRYNWTQTDLQLFTNEQALAQASQAKVCQLVHDWFGAQLDVKDPDMQVRLLVDSLKPVVAG